MPSLVFGPVLRPPWRRHLPLAIAGDAQSVPFPRFIAPQRGAALAASMPFCHAGSCGLLSVFITAPLVDAPGDDGLTTITDVDVLDGDDLFAASPELVQGEGALLKRIHHLR